MEKHTRVLPPPELKKLVIKKLKLGHKKPYGNNLGLSEKHIRLALHYYMIKN